MWKWLLIASFIATPAFANLSDDVDKLIAQVELSSCEFIRNGERHNQQEAAEHLRRKWDYAKDDVSNLDEFITEIASKSWFTGKPYMVECGTNNMTSAQWLTQLWHQANQ